MDKNLAGIEIVKCYLKWIAMQKMVSFAFCCCFFVPCVKICNSDVVDKHNLGLKLSTELSESLG